ncbi:TRAP transporter substrate-binding protein [Chloroflexota bacterium]
MKKKLLPVIALVVTISLLLGAFGCAKEVAPPTTPSEPAAPSEEPAAAPPPAAEEVIKWRMQISLPMGILGDVAGSLAEDINTLSAGRLEVELFPAGAIVGAYEVFAGVIDGVLEAAYGWPDWAGGGFIPAGGAIWQQPGENEQEFLTWYYHGGGVELVNELHEEYPVKLLLAGIYGPEPFILSNKPILKLDDLEGLKMRTGGWCAKIYESLGVTVIGMSGTEIYGSLEKGIIDATEYSCPALNWELGFHEVIDYMVVPGLQAPTCECFLAMYEEAWDELPAEIQAVIEIAAKKAVFDFWLRMGYEDMLAVQKYEDYGVEIIVLPQEVIDAWEVLYYEIAEEQAEEWEGFGEIQEIKRQWREQWRPFATKTLTTALEKYQ